MPRRFRSRRGFGVVDTRRQTAWLEIPSFTATMGAASTATFNASLTANEKLQRPFTIVRVRGYFHLESDQSAASEFYGATLSMSVVSDQASAIGVTALPTPETDKESDSFFLYESLFGSFLFGTAVGFVTAGVHRSFDSKAMRKVQEGQDVVLVCESSTLSAGCLLRGTGRVLIKLH